MNNSFDKQLNQYLIFFIIETLILILGFQFFSEFIFFIALVLLIVNGVLLLISLFLSISRLKQRQIGIQQVLGKEAKQAFIFGNIGLVTLDDHYQITWFSDLFDETNTRFIGEKVITWIPEISDLIRGNAESIHVSLRNRVYQVKRFKEGKVLFFKDITNERNVKQHYQEEKVVLGLLILDNFESETQFEEEQKKVQLDQLLIQPIYQWANTMGLFIRRVSNDRFLLVLNEKILDKMIKDRFSISTSVKKAAFDHDLAITVSLAISKGTSEFKKLEEMLYSTIELISNRGGDQVAIKSENEEIKYFGASSQSNERESKVKVRAMAHTLFELIKNSENVIIVGHNMMDFDCISGALGMSKIIQKLGQESYILLDKNNVEGKLSILLEEQYDHLQHSSNFISMIQAKELIKPSTLLLLVDHHTKQQSQGGSLFDLIKKIAVVDHHRRVKEFDYNPLFVYQDTNASSTIEIVSELFEYTPNKLELSELEATIMMVGLMIDTNQFLIRSGSRTFNTAAYLREMGADLELAQTYLQDDFNEYKVKNEIQSTLEKIGDFAIFVYDKSIISRTLMSQVADEAIKVRGISASFVVGKVSDSTTAISARSKSDVNVQRIMEQLGGGGHFNASATQSDIYSTDQLSQKLKNILVSIQQEEKQ